MAENFATSHPSFSRNLDLRGAPDVDVGVINTEHFPVYPNASFESSQTPLEFIIPSSANLYTDLANSFLYLRLKIVKGTASLAGTDIVGASAAFFSSLFTSCELQINNTPVTKTAPSLYAYKHYLETLLYSSENEKSTQLKNELWLQDSEIDKFTLEDNEGFKLRVAFTSQSKAVELIGRISDSLTNQPKYLPTGVEVRILLRRSSPKFSLCGTAVADPFPYDIKILNAIYWVRRHTVHPKILQEHNSISKNLRFNYPFINNELRSFQMPTGSQNYNSSTLYMGTLPSLVIIGLVASENFAGSITTSPFVFKDFNLSSLILTSDGDSHQFRLCEVDVENNIYLMAFNSLKSVFPESFIGNGLSRDNYTKGNFLIAFELNPNTGPNKFHSVKHGQIKLELKFKKALDKPVVCICLAQFQYCLQIDKDKNIFSDATII